MLQPSKVSLCVRFCVSILALSLPVSAGIARNPETGKLALDTTNYFESANAMIAPAANVTLAENNAEGKGDDEAPASTSTTAGSSLNADPVIGTSEPGTLLLACLGLGAIGLAGRRHVII
jgi:hypothetical protein